MVAVRALRVLLVILYASYLTNVGLAMILLPWSEGWSRLILLLPPGLAYHLDAPAVRGLVTGFGVLHLALLVGELVAPGRLTARDT